MPNPWSHGESRRGNASCEMRTEKIQWRLCNENLIVSKRTEITSKLGGNKLWFGQIGVFCLIFRFNSQLNEDNIGGTTLILLGEIMVL